MVKSQEFVSCVGKKKEISWDDQEYLDRVLSKELRADSRVWGLERKVSVGPCKSRTYFSEPSGFMFCVPKKSSKSLSESSSMMNGGINISLSGKSFSRKSSNSALVVDKSSTKDNEEKRAVKVDIHIPYKKIFKAVTSKVDVVRTRIRCITNK